MSALLGHMLASRIIGEQLHVRAAKVNLAGREDTALAALILHEAGEAFVQAADVMADEMRKACGDGDRDELVRAAMAIGAGEKADV